MASSQWGWMGLVERDISCYTQVLQISDQGMGGQNIGKLMDDIIYERDKDSRFKKSLLLLLQTASLLASSIDLNMECLISS